MKHSFIFIPMVLLFLIANTVQAQENKFKAIFIYKFIESTQWPNNKTELTIGMVGDTEVTREFQNLIQSKKITSLNVKRIRPDEANTCDVVFIPSSSDGLFNTVIKNTNGESILVITETSDLAKKGAGICFLKDGAKLNFIINRASIESGNLKIAQSVIQLAKEVI